MRHRRKGRLLKRKKGQRNHLLKSLMRSLVQHGSIVTTTSRAKELRPRMERLISKEKKHTLSGHRSVISDLGKSGAHTLKHDIVPRFEGRKSGYLRVIRVGNRKGDTAPLSKIIFVD